MVALPLPAPAVILKFAVAAPPPTVTVDGTVNHPLELANATTAPPAGATWLSTIEH